ncbi:MAG: diacylglycerol/lipid kinase family protein [Candidatus Bipolaricaulia bacterium]
MKKLNERSTSVFLIVNPVAGRGRAKRALTEIERALEARGIRCESALTRAPQDGIVLAQDALATGTSRIVAVGGDGTVNEVANGIVRSGAGAEVALGIIPFGVGNDLARVFGIPRTVRGAIEAICQDRRIRIDVGRVNDRYFLNRFGLGIDAAVVNTYRHIRIARGSIVPYIYAVIRELLAFEEGPVEIHTPEWRYRGAAFLVNAANAPHTGRYFRITPDARMDDGQLDLLVIEELPRAVRFLYVLKAMRGTHLSLKKIHLNRVRTVEVNAPTPLPAHIDGDLIGIAAGRFTVEVEPGALTVITNR